MTQDTLKVRVAKRIAFEKIRKHYERTTKKLVSLDEISKLVNETNIPKEVYDDSIVELIDEKKLIPIDSQTDETIILNIPQYLVNKVSENSFEIDTLNFDPIKSVVNDGNITTLSRANESRSAQDMTSTFSNLFNNPIETTSESFSPFNVQNQPYYSKVLPQYKQAAKDAENLFQNISLSQKIAQNKNNDFHIPKINIPNTQPCIRNPATLEARYAVMNVPEFSGTNAKKVFEFVEKVDNVYRIVDANQINLLNILILNKLTEDAEQLVRDQKPNNWQELRRILLDHFATRKSVNKRIGDLVMCKQGSGTVTKFAGELQGICTGIRYAAREENMDVRFVQDLLIKTFIDGLNREIGLVVRAQRPNNYQDALRLAIETETDISPVKFARKYCNFCRRDSHNTRDCRLANRQNRNFTIDDSKESNGNDKSEFKDQNKNTSYNWKNKNSFYERKPNYNDNRENFRSKGSVQNYAGRNSNFNTQGYRHNQNYDRRNFYANRQNYNTPRNDNSKNDMNKTNDKNNDNNGKEGGNKNRVNLNRIRTQTHAVVLGRIQ